jgi:hypothetical protein
MGGAHVPSAYCPYVNDKYERYAVLALEHQLLSAHVTECLSPALTIWLTKDIKATY